MKKKMSKRAAWKYLGKLWASPLGGKCGENGYFYVDIKGVICVGICECIQILDSYAMISSMTTAQMLLDVCNHAPRDKYCGFRWSYISINGAKARSRFCLKMAERKEK